MANTKISALTANTNPSGSEEFVFADNNANGKITLNTMKAFVGGAGVSTLNSDANIWELPAGTYETTYDLYYKSGERVPLPGSLYTKKTRIVVTAESTGEKGYFMFGVAHSGGTNGAYSYYGNSISSSSGKCFQLNDREWTFKQYNTALGSGNPRPEPLADDTIVQILDGIDDNDTNEISISNTHSPYPGVTYTIVVNSVSSGQTYTISLGTGVTNPLNITLPSSSNKKCVITILVTSTTTAIITGCTIAS